MNKRFVIILDSSTKAQTNEIHQWIKDEKIGWWHWIENTWLIATAKDHLTAAAIRDKLGELCPGVHCLVLELDEGEGTWSGFGPNGKEKNMFTWLKENWK